MPEQKEFHPRDLLVNETFVTRYSGENYVQMRVVDNDVRDDHDADTKLALLVGIVDEPMWPPRGPNGITRFPMLLKGEVFEVAYAQIVCRGTLLELRERQLERARDDWRKVVRDLDRERRESKRHLTVLAAFLARYMRVEPWRMGLGLSTVARNAQFALDIRTLDTYSGVIDDLEADVVPMLSSHQLGVLLRYRPRPRPDLQVEIRAQNDLGPALEDAQEALRPFKPTKDDV
jgi:hypothetical protein